MLVADEILETKGLIWDLGISTLYNPSRGVVYLSSKILRALDGACSIYLKAPSTDFRNSVPVKTAIKASSDVSPLLV